MRTLLVRLLAAVVPVIAILVAAAFMLPADFLWLPRQLLLAAVGIGGIALAEVAMFRTPLADLGRRLGIIATNRRTVIITLGASLPMWLFLPLAAFATGTPAHIAPNWFVLILGTVLVNGIAEEVIHRAFFFGRVREHTSFVKAAGLSAALFGAQHLYLIATIGVAGIASVVLAVLLAYPLCRAYEIGGRSIVGPTILHTSSNAAFLVFGDASDSSLLMLHMLVVLISIYMVFLFGKPTVLATARPAVASAFPDLET